MARTTRDQDAGAAVADKEPQSEAVTATSRETRRGPEAGPRDTPPAQPTYDDIARRAYELYQERGGTGGQDFDDWLRAEAELKQGRGRRDDEV